MDAIALSPGGVLLPRRIVRTSPWIPCPSIEELFPAFTRETKEYFGRLLRLPLKERIAVLMSGSLGLNGAKPLADVMFGATAFTADATLYFGLWAAALDDTFSGATGSECAYTSYARLGLTNNSTIFATGSGTTTYTKTFPSDAAKSFATSTGTGSNNTVTYLGILSGNAGTSGDKGRAWCSITSTTINNGDTPQLAQNAVTGVFD